MDLKELVQWLASGESLELSNFDIDQSLKPKPGEPVVGYRVSYTMTHPDTQETLYKSPLTYHRKGSMFQDESEMARSFGQSWERDDLLRSTNPIHNPKESDQGFYYFADKEMAESYMKMIALGKVYVKDNDNPLTSGAYDSRGYYESQREDAPLMLTLNRVTGIADETMNEFEGIENRKEGLRMKDMQIEEQVLSIPVQDISFIGSKWRNVDDAKIEGNDKMQHLKQWANRLE